jgi:hypothetical protein
MKTWGLIYPSHCIDIYASDSAEVLYSLICAYQGILDSFANLGTALGLPVVQKDNNIKDFTHKNFFPDKFQFACRDESAFRVRIDTVPYDFCLDKPPKDDNITPPPPPPPPPHIPPPTPLDGNNGNPQVSPPYNPPNDDGDSIPHDGDTAPPPPPTYWEINFNYGANPGQFPIGIACVQGFPYENPVFLIDPDSSGTQWSLFDGSTSGRRMYYHWIGNVPNNAPVLVSATFVGTNCTPNQHYP